MRHLKSGKKLGRTRAARRSLFRALSESLILREKVTTTLAKAKELRGAVEPLVTKAKRGTLHDRRLARKMLCTNKAVEALFHTIAPRYRDRRGGYTRITKTGTRENDAGKMAMIEFV